MNKVHEHHISSTFRAIKKFGLAKSNLLNSITKDEHIEHLRPALKSYFLLYHSSAYFNSHSQNGIYKRANDPENYIIIYNNCTRYQAIKSSNQLRLSFRVPHPEYNLPSYVMVSLS